MDDRVSYRVALGGIVSAFCLICMFLTGIFPLLNLTLPMISGTLLLIVVEEVGMAWGWLTYAAVSLLSLFITFDKEAAMIFILFFGSYPLLRRVIGKLRPKVLCILVKLVLFNCSMLAYFYLNIWLFGLTELRDSFLELGRYAGIIVLVLLNPFLLIYDYLMDALCQVYRLKLKPRITGRN